jgi:hypothetical protein
MNQPPRRRYCLIATVQGDDPGHLRAAVTELVEWVLGRGLPPEAGQDVLASPSRSYCVELEVRPEVTPESYQAELARYVADLDLPAFEGDPLGTCYRCSAVVFPGTRHAEHEGKLLCDECCKRLV